MVQPLAQAAQAAAESAAGEVASAAGEVASAASGVRVRVAVGSAAGGLGLVEGGSVVELAEQAVGSESVVVEAVEVDLVVVAAACT